MPRTRVLAFVFAGIGLLVLARVASVEARSATFGFEDATLDTMPPSYAAFADLARGTLTLEGDVLRATIELAALPEMTVGMAYIFVFSNGTDEHYAAAVTAPDLVYLYGEWISDEEGPDGTHETNGSYAIGAPGRITIDVPLRALDGSTVLTAPRALAGELKGGLPVVSLAAPDIVVVDEASGEGELWLPQEARPAEDPEEAAEATPDSTPAASGTDGSEAAAPVPGFGASIALAAAAGALLAGRRLTG